jgi:energy-coupling factor transport system ATP-binding protein
MAIRFEKVNHFYEKPKKGILSLAAINDINLSIESQGEFVTIVGHTGSGKSTLLQHINGLLLPTDGLVYIDDLVLTKKKRKNPKLKPIRKNIGFVFQFPEYQLFEETVIKDIIYGPKNFGMDQEEAVKNAKQVAEELNISNILEKSPFNISGGQMRKVAIAGILAYHPEILLLDEPTRGLDPLGAKEIMTFFKELQVKENKTIIMITHDMDLVYEYSTRVVVMDQGRIVYDGDKETLFKEEYKNHHLTKPKILEAIDFINESTGRNIGYNNYTLDDLLKSLKDGDFNE